MGKGRLYTEYEMEYLREHYKTDGAPACAKALGRTVASVYNKCHLMGIEGDQKTRRPYTQTEILYMKAHYTDDHKSIAKVLGRSEGSVRNKLSSLKMTKYVRWTPESEQYLREHYPHELACDIAEHLGKRRWSVIRKAFKMNLKKADDFLEKTKAQRSERQSRAQRATGAHGIKDYKRYMEEHPDFIPPWEKARGKKRSQDAIERQKVTYQKTRRAEERRIVLGLPRKTKLKIKI